MSARPLTLATGIAMALVASTACRSGPASKPDDLLLNAIRADEQEGNQTYARAGQTSVSALLRDMSRR
jgi:hypothetical protein